MPSATSSVSSDSSVCSGHRWIVIGDLHDRTAHLADIPGLSDADGIIVTGDLTLNGGIHQARRVLDALRRHNPVVYAQIGNMDRGEISDWLQAEGWNTHRQIREIAAGTALMGLGGSTFTPFGTPSEFPESRFAEWLEDMWQQARNFRRVVLSTHTPPYDTLCDVIGNGTHVGSTAVRDFLLDAQPAVCLCGHIHESRAVDRLGRTILVNTGAFSMGGYAELRLAGDDLTVTLHVLGE